MAADGVVKFGNYYLLSKIAVGGMAEIWRAKTVGVEGFERIVALKCIIPSYTQSQEFRTMFVDEARIASSLNHSNIVRITNFGEFEGNYYHEMEYVEGRNLRQLIQKAKEQHITIPVDSACFVISEILKGLDFAHRKYDQGTNMHLNIIHRDMSPQNIMLSFEGEIKIIDWGIAKAKGKVEETRAGVLKGKFGYMSPEQAGGEDLDNRTDIFSVGIILYEACTGERLFTAENEINILKKIQSGVIPSPRKINASIKPELEEIILKALKKDRNERYTSALEMHEALMGFLNKFYPAFTTSKLSRFIKELFSAEIVEERKVYNEQESSSSSLSWSEMGSGDKTKISKNSTNTDEVKYENSGSYSEKSPFDTKTIVDSRKASFQSLDNEKTVIAKSNRDGFPPIPDSSVSSTDFDMPMAGDKTQKVLREGKHSKRNKAAPNRKRLISISIFIIVIAFVISEYDPFALNKTGTQEIIKKQTVVEPVTQPVTQPQIQPEIQTEVELEVQPAVVQPEAKIQKEKKQQSLLQPIQQPQIISKNIGLLSLDVSPNCLIYIDGKLVSKFKPIDSIKLKPGKHKLSFVNKNLKINSTIDINIKGGQHIRRTVTLR